MKGGDSDFPYGAGGNDTLDFGDGVSGNDFLDGGWNRHQGDRPHKKKDLGLPVGRSRRASQTSRGPDIHTARADTETKWKATP